MFAPLPREDARWTEAEPDGFGEARLVFAHRYDAVRVPHRWDCTNDVQLFHAFFATAKGHSGQRIIRFATRSMRPREG